MKPLWITHWVCWIFNDVGGPVVLSNLLVKNNNAGGLGISIAPHRSTVTLTNVTSSGNAGGGLNVIVTYTGKTVTITNSSFDDNGGNVFANGIYIKNQSSVSINGVTASGNAGTKPSLWLASTGNLVIKNSIFSHNPNSDGIRNYDELPVSTTTLENIIASNNGGSGIKLYIKGFLIASGIQANQNTGSGAYLNTYSSFWPNPTSGNINISSSQFNQNNDHVAGLNIGSKGTLTLVDVQANGNNSMVGGLLQSSKSVSVINGEFSNNNSEGLHIGTKGLVILSKVRADNNGTFGLFSSNDKSDLVIKGSAAGDNSFSDNGQFGIIYYGKGTVRINIATVNGNGDDGMRFLIRRTHFHEWRSRK